MDLRKYSLSILLGFILIFLILFWIFGGPSSVDLAPIDYFINREGKNGCCRVCYVGVACGNSCIKRVTPCDKPPGCACNRKVPIYSEDQKK